MTRSADSPVPDPLVKKYQPEPGKGVVEAPPIKAKVPEIGGRKDGTEPTRFGDWEKDGRCIDF